MQALEELLWDEKTNILQNITKLAKLLLRVGLLSFTDSIDEVRSPKCHKLLKVRVIGTVAEKSIPENGNPGSRMIATVKRV